MKNRTRTYALVPSLLLAISLVATSCASDDAALDDTVLAGDVALADGGTADSTTVDSPATEESESEDSEPEENESEDSVSSASGEIATTDDEGVTAMEDEMLASELDALPVGELTQEEIDGLAFMREEEKLAGDVYVALYDEWGLNIFNNISGAESTHTAAVKTLLDRYDIADPSEGLAPGEFTNPEIQALYDDLVETGSQSVVDALRVGALIEDLDISDLQDRATQTPDINLVYDNLERGSRNHMRAFIRQLDAEGVEYTPIYLSQAEFDEIISTPTEQGSGHGEGGGHEEGEGGGHGEGGEGKGGKGNGRGKGAGGGMGTGHSDG